MKINVTIDEKELRSLVKQRLSDILNTVVEEKDICIEVKSKQNYKAEWEIAAFRATVTRDTCI